MSGPASTTTRRPVLRDPALDAALEADGYAIVPLLDADEVVAIRRDYEAIRPDTDTGLAIDYSREDRALVRQVSELLGGVWDRHLPDLFVDHQPLLSTFLTKYPGDDSAMRLHREPTYTEPVLDDMHVIWVPLVDVTAESGNGALEIIPGTQHLPPWLSGHDTPEVFRPYEPYLRRHARSVDLPAGTALVFHARMLHFSATNTADHPRMAFGAVMTPRDSQLIHVVATGRRGREIYVIDRDFITDCHPTEVRERVRERYPLLRVATDDTALSPAQVAAAVGGTDLPEIVPSMPDDVAAAAGPVPLRPLAGEAVPGAPRPTEDVTLGAADLPAAEVAWAPVQPGTYGSAVGPLADALAAGVLPDLAGLAERPDAAVVVVDPGSRLHLDLIRPGGAQATVYECPVVHAGVRTHDAVGQFEVGERIALPEGPMTLWNEGPGPLWVVLDPAAPVPLVDGRADAPADRPAPGGWRPRIARLVAGRRPR